MKLFLAAVGALCVLSACATRQPDYYHVLSVQPPGAGNARTAPATLVSLRVTVPSVQDRAQMVLNMGANAIEILEHQRWAAPLSDLMTETLARDLERRRADLLIADSRLNRTLSPALKIAVDVVQMSATSGGHVGLEAHWRILDTRSGKEEIGGEVFSSSAASGAVSAAEEYSTTAQALSVTLGLLADRLMGQLH